MKLITKKRVLNWFSIAALIAMPMILVLSFLIQSSIIDILFVDDFSDIPASEVETAKDTMISQLLDWNYYHIYSNMFTPLFYPLFATLPVLFLTNENHDYMAFEFVRTRRYKSTVINKCLKYSLLSGVIMMVGYWIFISIGALLNLKSPEYDCGMLMDFIPNLMNEKPIVGGMVHGMTVYFPFGFIFGLFAAGVAINTRKSYLTILVPHIYYLLVGNILSAFYNTTNNYLLQQLSPWHPVTITGQSYAAWYTTYYSLIPILIISLLLIAWRLKNESKVSSQ
ncbi:MAG: hypothetical protein IJ010_02540 [Ruminococcus sp.]|nr:hypothetical protein [Ruminococcus sp.]